MKQHIFSVLMALVLFSSLSVFAADDATLGSQPGALIDNLMGKTAESALPQGISGKHATAETSKNNVEATQPVFSNPAAVTAHAPTTGSHLWGRMVLSLFIALSIFGGGVYAYRRWPGSKKISQRSRMVEVLTQHHFGPRRSVAVVRVAGESVLIGLTDTSITFLKNLSLLDDDVPQDTREAQATLKNAAANKFQETFTGKVKAESISREDEFSMQGLKDFIGNRLKDMKEIS
jgi:flagellar biogenesis protein FliO